MDFEINKLAQPDLRTAGAKTLNRSPGDLLVTSDFTNNGGNLMLGLLMWIANANGAATDYYFTNVLPCWGAPPTQDVLDGLDDNRIDPSDAITVSVDAQLDGGTAFTIVGKAADDSTVASGSTGIIQRPHAWNLHLHHCNCPIILHYSANPGRIIQKTMPRNSGRSLLSCRNNYLFQRECYLHIIRAYVRDRVRPYSYPGLMLPHSSRRRMVLRCAISESADAISVWVTQASFPHLISYPNTKGGL